MSNSPGTGFRLLYDREHPGRSGELDASGLAELYRHPVGSGAGWLRTNFVSTLAGAISGPDGRSGSINTVSDHRVFAIHRALADVIMVGAGTVRTEGYRAVDLADWQHELRGSLGLPAYPTLAVVTASLDLDPEIARPDHDHGPVLIISTPQPTGGLGPFVAAGAQVLELGDPGGQVPLGAAVAELVGAGLPRILCEGGPRLHRDLLAAGVVDELSLTLAPVAVGGTSRRSTDGPPLPDPAAFRLQHVACADDETLFASYRRTPGRSAPAGVDRPGEAGASDRQRR